MRTVDVIHNQLTTQLTELADVRTRLKTAEARVPKLEQALDAAVRGHYDGTATEAEVAKARADCTHITEQIDNLRRIIPMLDERIRERETELREAQRWEADQARRSLEATMTAIYSRVLDAEAQLQAVKMELNAACANGMQEARARFGDFAQEPHLNYDALRKTWAAKRGQ